MSEENVERVRSALAVIWPRAATNPDAPRATEQGRLREFFAPGVVWDLRTFTDWPARSQFRGLNELGEFVDAWPFHHWSYEIVDAGGNRVLAAFHPRSEALIDQPYGIVYTIKDGLIQRGQVYASIDDALEAAGLRE